MAPDLDFHPVADAGGDERREIGIGMIGYGFMGKAHSNAYHQLPYIFWPSAGVPRLVAICGRDPGRVADAARRYGYAGYYTDWRGLVADKRVQVVDNCASHQAHVEPTIAAAEAGKHVLCEKPLGLDATEARRMRDAAARAGVTHMVAFNYRFAPAVRLARQLVDAGHLGRIQVARFSYLQDWQANPTLALPPRSSRNGVLLGLGSHVIDLARFLVGEPSRVSGLARTFNRWRPPAGGSGPPVEVEDDDAMVAHVEFASGAIGNLEAAWICPGRKNRLSFEIHGARGSLTWDLEDLNRLKVYLDHDAKIEGIAGFEEVLVTGTDHPYVQAWWPPGHVLGWENLHVNLIRHFVEAVALGQPVEPWGATFEDGYRAAVISEAIVEASTSGKEVSVDYARET